MELIVSLIMSLIFFGFIFKVVSMIIKANLSYARVQKKSADASIDPNNSTVTDFIYELNQFKLVNHQKPEFYNAFRQTFMIVNNSPNVSTELKVQLREAYIRKSIMLPTQNIIDNYQSNKTNTNTDFESDGTEFYKKK